MRTRRERILETMSDIMIVGGGLVGSLLSIFLARRGCTVRIYDRKPDPRTFAQSSGRSINLTLCERGFAALERVGAHDAVRAVTIPAYGRQIHAEDGQVAFQPYGNEGEALYSITRNELNRALLDIAEKEHGVRIHFGVKCVGLDPQAPSVVLEDQETGARRTEGAAWVFGSDGAFSAVRLQLQRTDRFDFSQSYLDQGYKELTVPPAESAAWRLDLNALHIWPRGRYMLIGFPNFDGSTTLALHLPFEGEVSFAAVRDEKDLFAFFNRSFPDTVGYIPNLAGDFFGRPVSSMVTVRCNPWVRGRVALIGDAAHAVVPSFGQGANCGFEDCAVLDACLDRHGGDWEVALAAYERERKPNADAIADLSLLHFGEIRDRVGDPRFLLSKAVERRLEHLHPDRYRSLYSLVSFTTITYVEALRRARTQEALVERILEDGGAALEHLDDGGADALLQEHVRRASLPPLARTGPGT
ncbi:MAG TPA: kynurenine 3-monooxygenase [Acidobacteria bacterium]|nr:kynurenine 3-monooxygenase [Acidobacteriota bacterium]